MFQRNLKESQNKDEKFGTFKGVFTPSILTILGVIMYLRFGWVVGHGGIIGAIVVVLLAHVISYTTGLSVSSIATNRTVKTGGDYYMISRSLGLPIGGAIGLALFFALALSTSL
ncbi:MAG: Na-K-Cl cotransporter, partial [Deltaproteobacteria bacterium]|nr:Na-K-Cl cotransporter [Deltaproteobacteria bacterium]